MISIKTSEEIDKMLIPSQLVAKMHRELGQFLKPGVTTMDVEHFVKTFAERTGARCAQIGYLDYPYATCSSVNDCIAHGFPDHTPLKDGDIVTIDTVFDVAGWKGDSAWTYCIGRTTPQTNHLVYVAKQCLLKGLEQVKPGNYTGDIAYAIQTCAESFGYGVVEDLLSHGIGREIHEEPFYPHVGQPGTGTELTPGMVLTVEPMINEGTPLFFIDEDGWSARTLDGLNSAQFEHTVAITDQGLRILTDQES
ncbi:type I methionyl aminopeptidase [Geomicrobium sp. JCM 19038]|uniref:type I methionyl aminopeptidase n=1 Tax=Geomicrobium sp. JCM 19038 TaxID=1460635 RepID=UPI0005A9B4A3|nr:type I methionyl aminopeptidase [Geomicrobium sp. JCM 19038]